MTVNINSESQRAAEDALLVLNNLINDLNVALALGGDVQSQLTTAQGSQATLLAAIGSTAPWGVGAAATTELNVGLDSGKVISPAYVGSGGTPSVLLGQPGSIVAEGSSGTYDPSDLGLVQAQGRW